MSEPREPYISSTAPIGTISTVTFDVTPAERNLILRLRQHRGMLIVDADSMCWWAANKMEQGNGKTPQAQTLPYRMDFT
jgi:hypothetical protein